MPRKKSPDETACDYAELVLSWVREALDNYGKPMGLFNGGLLHGEVAKAHLCIRARNKRAAARASRGRYNPENITWAQSITQKENS